MKIALGSDHRGLEFKQGIETLITKLGYDCQDFGSYDTNPVDYPDIAGKVAAVVSSGEYNFGILICGTGIGMSIAANKIRGIRAALCRDVFDADRARQHNDANILCLGSERTGLDVADEIIQTFLSEQFQGGRHFQRLEKIRSLENITFDNRL
jgi:ribose 5-phosphate isomerase B